MYSQLFTRGKINGMDLKNRVVMAPMHDSLGQISGEVSPRAIAYYASRAKGGCGLIIPGYVSVIGPELSGIAAPGQTHLHHKLHRIALAAFAERIHEYGAKLVLQLHHPGRQGHKEDNNGNENVSCTAMPSALAAMPPMMQTFARELAKEEIKTIVEAFAKAAKACFDAGVDGVEIHCAHGYLLSQFISPVKNERTDEYGGSLENRCRIVAEIISAIRKVVPPSYPIIVRINGMDGEYIPGEGDHIYMAQVAKYLSENGADAIDVSAGGTACITPPDVVSGTRNYFIKHIKDSVNVPIIAVNEIRTPEEAEAALAAGVQDFCSLGRQHIADPEWANKAESGRAEDIRPCLSCNTCLQKVAEELPIRCAINPLAGKEIDFSEPQAGNGTVAVIGTGPGGIQAALTASQRGFKVVLLDKASEIGGALQLANKAPNKFRMDNLIAYYRRQIDQDPNIELRLNDHVTSETLAEIKALNPYAVILATGGKPLVPKVPGVEKAVIANDVLSGKVKFSDKKVVIVGGGMTGLETAELLVAQGNRIVVLEMLPAVGNGIMIFNVLAITMPMTAKGHEIKTNTQLLEIKDKAVVATDLTNNATTEIDCDAVVMAIGVLPEDGLLPELDKVFAHVINIGDSARPGKIITAVHDGYYLTKNI